MKIPLRSSLLVPVWIALALAIGCIYWGFKYEALADAKESKFELVQQHLSKVDCKEINVDVLLSIGRQSFEAPRDAEKLFWTLAMMFFGMSALNLGCVWSHLRKEAPQRHLD